MQGAVMLLGPTWSPPHPNRTPHGPHGPQPASMGPGHGVAGGGCEGYYRPQKPGGGGWEKGSIDRTINQIMKSGADFFHHLQWSILPMKSKANDDFSEPPRHAASESPFFIFAEFRVRAWGLGRILGPR